MTDSKLKISKIAQLKLGVVTSWKILKIAWSVSPFLLIGNLITFALPSILPFINIYIYKLIIDYLIQAVAQHQTDIRPLLLLLFFRFLTSFIQEVSFKLQKYFEHVLWLKVPITLSEMVFGKLMHLDIRYFEDSQFRELLQHVGETYRFRTLNMLSYLMFTFQSFLQLLIAAIAIASIHWALILIIILVSLIEFLHQMSVIDADWGIWWGNSPDRKKFNYLSNLLQDAGSLKEIKIFQLGSHFLKDVIKAQQKFYEETKKSAKRNLIVSSGVGLLSTIASVGVEAFVISRALIGQFTIGDIGFYTGVITNFQNGLSGFLRNAGSVFEASLYVKSIFELLDAEPFVKQADHPVKIDLTSPPKIEFKNVTFSYPGAENPILKDFSLTIMPGDKIAFVGENGAGKSTIIKLLARFYDVDAGEILINDINIKELDTLEWHRHMGVLFQDFNRYEHTAAENIFFGNIAVEATSEKIKEAAASSGAESVIENLSKKYDQQLGKTYEDGVELSTGQWQKVALARSFFRNAPLLILDEPTAAIDAKAESEIFESVEKLSKEKTVIIISHRFSTVRNADKIYVINNGSIIESGSHEELMKEKGKYSQLFTLQAKGYQ